MKKRNIKALGRRGLSLLLALVMCLGLLNLTVFAADEGFLICEKEEHTHTADCYVPDYDAGPICGLEEGQDHTHTAECYQTVTKYTCGLEESDGHVHTDSCYNHSGLSWDELTCGQTESEGHHHTDACYSRELTCGQTEHTHSEACLDENGELICGQAEHTHSDGCYTETLTCGQEESEGHKHTAECYTVVYPLTCRIPVGEGAHHHTEDCTTVEQELVCGQAEGGHTHTDACYPQKLVCEKEEHVHTAECYELPQESDSVTNGTVAQTATSYSRGSGSSAHKIYLLSFNGGWVYCTEEGTSIAGVEGGSALQWTSNKETVGDTFAKYDRNQMLLIGLIINNGYSGNNVEGYIATQLLIWETLQNSMISGDQKVKMTQRTLENTKTLNQYDEWNISPASDIIKNYYNTILSKINEVASSPKPSSAYGTPTANGSTLTFPGGETAKWNYKDGQYVAEFTGDFSGWEVESVTSGYNASLVNGKLTVTAPASKTPPRTDVTVTLTKGTGVYRNTLRQYHHGSAQDLVQKESSNEVQVTYKCYATVSAIESYGFKIKVQKTADFGTDANKDLPLSGAVFGIFDGSGEEQQRATSDANGVVTFPDQVVYANDKDVWYVQEIEAPAGFAKTETKYPLDTNNLIVTYTATNAGTFDPSVYKVVNLTGEKIGTTGAKFTLYFKQDNYPTASNQYKVSEYTIDETGKLNLPKLGYGFYLLVETEAPAGFVTPSDGSNTAYFKIEPGEGGVGAVVTPEGPLVVENELAPDTDFAMGNDFEAGSVVLTKIVQANDNPYGENSHFNFTLTLDFGTPVYDSEGKLTSIVESTPGAMAWFLKTHNLGTRGNGIVDLKPNVDASTYSAPLVGTNTISGDAFGYIIGGDQISGNHGFAEYGDGHYWFAYRVDPNKLTVEFSAVLAHGDKFFVNQIPTNTRVYIEELDAPTAGGREYTVKFFENGGDQGTEYSGYIHGTAQSGITAYNYHGINKDGGVTIYKEVQPVVNGVAGEQGGLNDKELFVFRLYQWSGSQWVAPTTMDEELKSQVAHVYQSNGGRANFYLHFTEAGTYYYKIAEENVNTDAYKQINDVYAKVDVTIVATRPVINVTYYKEWDGNGPKVDSQFGEDEFATIVNQRLVASAQLTAKKNVLSASGVLLDAPGESFQFTLYAVTNGPKPEDYTPELDENGEEIPYDEGRVAVDTAQSDSATGAIVFDELTYDLSDVGHDYWFVIRETDTTYGYIYDRGEFYAKVTVSKNDDGYPVASVTYYEFDENTEELQELDGTELEDGSTLAVFTNQIRPSTRTTENDVSVSVNKVWVGDDEFVRPTRIEVQLYQNGAAFGSAVVLSEGNWSYTWENLPEKDNSGRLYEYTVDEVSVPSGYTKSVTASGSYTYTITNTWDDTTIPDDDIPLSDLPDDDVPMSDIPWQEELEELPEPDVPLANVPATGDTSMMWLLASAASAAGLIWLTITGRKKEDDAE